jgi:hypothetical protein
MGPRAAIGDRHYPVAHHIDIDPPRTALTARKSGASSDGSSAPVTQVPSRGNPRMGGQPDRLQLKDRHALELCAMHDLAGRARASLLSPPSRGEREGPAPHGSALCAARGQAPTWRVRWVPASDVESPRLTPTLSVPKGGEGAPACGLPGRTTRQPSQNRTCAAAALPRVIGDPAGPVHRLRLWGDGPELFGDPPVSLYKNGTGKKTSIGIQIRGSVGNIHCLADTHDSVLFNASSPILTYFYNTRSIARPIEWAFNDGDRR